MRVRKFFIGVIGGLLVASIGSAASAGVLVTRSDALGQHVVIVFLAIWAGVGLLSLFARHPRQAWRLVLALAGTMVLCLPLAWHGFTVTEAQIDPHSLFVLSGERLGMIAVAISTPLAAVCFLLSYLVGSKR